MATTHRGCATGYSGNQNGCVNLLKKGNVKTLLPSKATKTRLSKSAKEITLTLPTVSTILNLVPTDMSIENLTFKLDDNGKKLISRFAN
jgi:hypothetical protein